MYVYIYIYIYIYIGLTRHPQAGHQDRNATSYRSGRGGTLSLTCTGGAWCWCIYSVERPCVWHSANDTFVQGSISELFATRACMCCRPAPTSALFRLEVEVVPHSM